MRRTRFGLAQVVLLLLVSSGVSAQKLEQLCPKSEATTGALVGIVSELDAQMPLPGTTVRVTWEEDGRPGRAETQAGLDGSFTLCYLPLGTELSVQAMVGPMVGDALPLTLTEPITRRDLGLSLTGAAGAGDAEPERIWACIGPRDSQMRMRLGGLVRCDPQWPPLEQCPREELGRVSASTGARGRGAIREVVERLRDEARRLGANALINVRISRGSIEAMAVKIEVDPSTC